MARSPKLKYDIAISFAEADAEIANVLYKSLKRKCIDVYYYKTRNQAGENLGKITSSVFKNGTNYAVVILSKDYVQGRWPIIEWQALQKARHSYYIKRVFVVRVDNTRLHGLSNDQIYIPWQSNPKEIARQIKEKIKGPTTCHLTIIKVGVILFLILACWLCFYIAKVY